MKPTRLTRSVGLGIALLSLATLPGRSQEFSAADARQNSAVARSPRALEAFPALARPASVRPVRTAFSSSNVAFNASPRMVEEIVESARPSRSANDGGSLPRRAWGVPLAANPRALEENPELARQLLPAAVEPTFQVAPLK